MNSKESGRLRAAPLPNEFGTKLPIGSFESTCGALWSRIRHPAGGGQGPGPGLHPHDPPGYPPQGAGDRGGPGRDRPVEGATAGPFGCCRRAHLPPGRDPGRGCLRPPGQPWPCPAPWICICTAPFPTARTRRRPCSPW